MTYAPVAALLGVALVLVVAVLLLAPGGDSPRSTAPLSVCFDSLQTRLDAAREGETLDLSGCVYREGAVVTKSLTLIGAEVNLTTRSVAADTYSLKIEADNVTVDGWKFVGGGQGIGIFGRDNVAVLNSHFERLLNGAIAIWTMEQGSDEITLEGNRIKQTRGHHVSPIGSRGPEDCSVTNSNLTIRDNDMDQGSATVGWFGIELFCADEVLVEGNRLSGGHTLLSLPHSQNVSVRDNEFDLTGSPFWAVEVPTAAFVVVQSNTVFGDGDDGDDYFVAMNSDSSEVVVSENSARDIRTLVGLGGTSVLITENCLDSVLRVTEFEESGEDVSIGRNGPC